MKLAFAHCRILQGWALNVLKDLIVEEKDISPKSEMKVFTLISEYKNLNTDIWELKITTALPTRLNNIFIKYTKQKVPVLSTIFDYRNIIVFSPILMRILSKKINKYNPDKLVISSFAIAKNIKTKAKTKLYLHSPMQYIRSHKDEYTAKLKWRRLKLFTYIIPKLKKRDLKFKKFDEIYANSKYTAELAKKIYWIKSKIKYPKVNVVNNIWLPNETLNYYVYMWRLVKFVKETDKIIKLFNITKDPLIIVWNGPDELHLKSIANDNIIFVDWIENETEKFQILSKAKGFINITKESFWISTVEALMLWIPVFWYNDWASPELVDSDSGMLVDNKDMKTLVSKFQEFKSTSRDREKIANSIINKLN